MPGREAALPPQFSLLQSEFNEFLFAPIGEESNDSVLTVLSALARTGIDPWQEAARLAQLSKAVATQRLTAIIAGLPNGRWAQADAGTIAARLVEHLPAQRAAQPVERGTANAKKPHNPLVSSRAKLVVVVALGSAVLFAVIAQMNRATVVDVSSPYSATATSPSVPVAGAK
jgi:hypothetical protein